ncbi:helix-turn-helix domain-containing protein [Amycolatopsis thermophila]|uniref:Transcriptional regulator with XRE-family HTH domain n=1 Tax=Amycolatopsis thermophila TaxID=206084 RepID=A0ABU0EVP6_9PSEU|nr:helix-turn-helix transcriptional regulator [Amycolatopsis thermophila]MDQ0379394.1 transcriptional regulator with XRE-family HTH domain [Amycolatopsis thermophila]
MAVEDVLDARLRALAIRVRKLRRDRDLSQADLADRAGVSRSVIAELERSRLAQGAPRPARNITLDTLFRMAEALGVHPAELLDDRE